MDAAQVRSLQPRLRKYLQQFQDCFVRPETRQHFSTYVQGQLSDLPRKSVEPIAIAAQVPPRTLQQFLNSFVWDQEQMIDTLQARVVRDHTSARSIGILDETACPKKGNQTPGVQRQWCGATGKTDNCVVTVHLGYAVDEFHCLLASELYLPESWATDRDRCRRVDIPDSLEYRAKWRIALELYDRARANGISFRYLVFDEGYGGKPEFLRELQQRGQAYVAEVPCSFTGWLIVPQVTERPYRRRRRGRGRATPRLMAGSVSAQSLEYHLNWTPALKDQAWAKWRIKDTHRGPLVWEAKHLPFVPKNEHGLPGEPLHLIVARNVADPSEVKYFLSNAPADTPLSELLLVAFSRWHIERCFEDQKTELGFDHFEGRSYLGLKRHQAVTSVTHLFLAEVRQELRGEKTRVDGLPGANRSRCPGSFALVGGPCGPRADRGGRGPNRLLSKPQRRRTTQSHQDHSAKTPAARHPSHQLASLPLEQNLAL
jgi:SRSO17 transposase